MILPARRCVAGVSAEKYRLYARSPAAEAAPSAAKPSQNVLVAAVAPSDPIVGLMNDSYSDPPRVDPMRLPITP
jgi:hypothetical protein